MRDYCIEMSLWQAESVPSCAGSSSLLRSSCQNSRHKPTVGALKLELSFRSVQASKPAWLQDKLASG